MENAITRRQAVAFAFGQAGDMSRPRLAPREQLVNVLEYEEQARQTLGSATAALITDKTDKAGERVDRQDFDRITLRPRMCVPTLDLDLTVTILGESLYAPIIVGPIADQKRFHPDAETATVRGAALAHAPVIVSSQPSVPLASLVTNAGTPIWAQVFASDPAAKQQMQAAADAGCGAICLTIGVRPPSAGAPTGPVPVRVDWAAARVLTAATRLPVVVKGVTSPADAKAALQLGVKGIIASNYGGAVGRGSSALILQLPEIVDAAANQVPVLVDGGFRRGSDIVKALAFGAQAVVIGRPVMWGLAAYGADGVRGVLDTLQTETARYMAMCGKSRVDRLQRDLLRVHGIAAPASTVNG